MKKPNISEKGINELLQRAVETQFPISMLAVCVDASQPPKEVHKSFVEEGVTYELVAIDPGNDPENPKPMVAVRDRKTKEIIQPYKKTAFMRSNRFNVHPVYNN